MNDAYFLPEDRPEVALDGVADEDRDTIDLRSLSLEPWPEPEPRRAPLRVAAREEIDVHWHGAPADEGMYRGSVQLVEEPAAFSVGENRGLLVRVVNSGTHAWPHGEVGFPATPRLLPLGATTPAPWSCPTGCEPRSRRRSHPAPRSSSRLT